jgi:hypothetical protein
MSGIWFYRSMGQQYGPLNAEELRTLARSGLLRPDTPVKPGRDAPWTVARNVKGLFSAGQPGPVFSAPPLVEAPPPPAAATAEPPPAVRPGSFASILVDGPSNIAQVAAADDAEPPTEPSGERWVIARNVLLSMTCGLVILVLLAWLRPMHRADKVSSKPVAAAASTPRAAAQPSNQLPTTAAPRKVTPAATAAAPTAADLTPQQRFEQFAKEVDARLAEVLKQTIQDDEETGTNATRASADEWRPLGASQQNHNGEVWESVAADLPKSDSPSAAPSGTLSFAWACRVGNYLPILSVVRWKCSYAFEGGRWTFKSARATVVKAAPYGMDAPEKELLSSDTEALRFAAETQCLEWLNPAFKRPILQLLQSSSGR